MVIFILFSVMAEMETCNLLDKGVAAIFGPQTLASAEHIRSITDVAEVPFIDTRWNMHPVNPVLTSNERNAYTINLHPDINTVGKNFDTNFTDFSDLDSNCHTSA